jgi:hypothetical protein
MNQQNQKHTAIKALLFCALMAMGALAWAAQVAGTIVNLSGPLMARKADGTVKILAVKSEVEQGDTLVAERNTYAQVRFVDNSEITLKPNTTFKIEAFSYDEGKPEADSASFNLVKGGLRSVTGLLGKRNKEKFALKTPTATIGIRGTTFIADYVPEDAQALAARQAFLLASTAGLGGAAGAVPLQLAQLQRPTVPPVIAPGLYVHVIDGLINVSNKGGTLNFSAGQFGFTPSLSLPPVVVPTNPGLKFAPPPTFAASALSSGSTSTAAKSNTVDCEVR